MVGMTFVSHDRRGVTVDLSAAPRSGSGKERGQHVRHDHVCEALEYPGGLGTGDRDLQYQDCRRNRDDGKADGSARQELDHGGDGRSVRTDTDHAGDGDEQDEWDDGPPAPASHEYGRETGPRNNAQAGTHRLDDHPHRKRQQHDP